MQQIGSLLILETGYPSVTAQPVIQAGPDGLQRRSNLFSGHSIMMYASNGHRLVRFHLYFPLRGVGPVSAALFHSPGGHGWVVSHLAVVLPRRRTRRCFSRSFRILEVSKEKF